MNWLRSRPWIAIVPLLVGGFALDRSDAVAQESCASASCHASLLDARHVHPATEACDTCHESVETSHPQAGRKTFRLVEEPPELCSACHDAAATKSQVHVPFQEGMCTGCHDPHASNEPHLLTEPLKELCEGCHDDKAELKHVHGPVSAGDCTACHAPHESSFKPLLVKEGDALCVGCHVDLEEALQQEHVHPALEGGCTSCHNPHGSEHPKLLPDEVDQVCAMCHDEIATTVETAPVVHAAVQTGDRCVSCHSPHASANAKLLLQPEKEACLGCHPAITTKSMTVLHGPINDGRCTTCHTPHGGQYAKLLVDEFPPGPYVPYTDTAFALCFGCHHRDLVLYPDTSFATGFRDGERNLHYLHVNNMEKGRSCRLCHVPHGSNGPRLIAANVPFGKWNLPLNFEPTATGGSCAPGCHKPQSYKR